MADELCMIHFSIIVEAVVQAQLMLYLLCCFVLQVREVSRPWNNPLTCFYIHLVLTHHTHCTFPTLSICTSLPSLLTLFPTHCSPFSPPLLLPFSPPSSLFPPSLMQMCWAAIVILPLGGWLPQTPGTLVTPGEQTSLTTTRQEGQHFVQSESCIQYSTESTALNQCLQ